MCFGFLVYIDESTMATMGISGVSAAMATTRLLHGEGDLIIRRNFRR